MPSSILFTFVVRFLEMEEIKFLLNKRLNFKPISSPVTFTVFLKLFKIQQGTFKLTKSIVNYNS
jgi:hypothetical protein